MKRVLIIGSHEMGIYCFRRELIEQLLEDGYEVYISYPWGERVAFFEKIGCKYVESTVNRHGTNPVTDLKLIRDYRKIVSEVQPDVVLTYTIKPNLYVGMVCRRMGIPYIATITGLGTAVENNGLLQTLTVQMYRYAMQKVHCIFFQNTENRQFFADRKIAPERHKLIPGSGVNLSQFQAMNYPPDDVVRFLFIARVMKEKGIDQYMEAAEIIRRRHPNTEFHVLGDCEGGYEDKLQDLHDRGVIRYHGLQGDIRPFLRISHCTVHPTYYPEGMSNALLESAASARPVIATNRSGCREIVDEGRNGFFVEAKNTADLVDKIECFLALPWEKKRRMGLAGRIKVEREFDRRIVVSAYLREIEKVCGIRHRRSHKVSSKSRVTAEVS
jgi:glycosyltransferase involved in cell wall biosynthesis